MVQATKCYLIYQEQDNMNYKQFCDAMFQIQRQVRKFKNRASSEYFSYMERQSQWKEEHGAYPTDEELLGYKMRNHLYHMAVGIIPELYSSGAGSTSESVMKYFQTRKKEIIRGDITIPSYRSDQPIDLHNNQIKFSEADGKTYVTLSMFSQVGKKQYGLSNGKIAFEVFHKCGSSLAIIDRCMAGEYKVCGSKLQYDKRKRMWELALSYSFDKREHSLDPDKILGLDLGIRHPIVGAISDEGKRWFVHGGEVEAFRAKREARRISMRKARVYAGDGSVGHGRKTRNKPVEKNGDKISKFRDTKNHAWAREFVKIAVKNGCGTIQMEDLSGISAGKQPKFLKDWTYYDLQSKIAYKAAAEGVKVVLVQPQYTSQRCSCCGHISADNLDDTLTHFHCLKCGYDADSDYNAARNIAIRNIDKIIKAQRDEKRTAEAM